jgi:mTERF domain-containing protein
VLTLNVEEKLKPVVEFFQSMGLDRERDMEMLLLRNAQIMCCSIEKNLRPKFTFFKDIGLSESAISNMIVLFPSMLGQSIEGSLAPKYEFLVNEMQRSINEVVDFPQYFGYSLDNRIKPRYEKLKDKAISPSLASMLACVDCDFDARYMSNHSPSRVPYKSRSKIGRSSD